MGRAGVGRRAAPHHKNERAAALVEFALVAPLLIALLVGTVTLGIALSRKNSMTNATREGARLGATLPADADWATSVRDRVVDLAGGDLEPDEVCARLVFKATDVDTVGTTVRASPSCAFAGDEPDLAAGTGVNDCVAKVWSRRTSEIETVFFDRTMTLTASAVARYERGSGSTCAAD